MKKIRVLVMAALFAAFTCIATMIIKFPTPTFGYIHLGDVFVLLSGIVLGPGIGALAAGIGSAFSDLFSGYLIYLPATLIIKGLTAYIAGSIFHRSIRKAFTHKNEALGLMFGGLLGEAFMTFGYFIYEMFLAAFSAGAVTSSTLLAGAASSAAGVPFNLVQGATGIILSFVLLPVLIKIRLLKPIEPRHSTQAGS